MHQLECGHIVCSECAFSEAECMTCGLRIGSLFDSDNSDPDIQVDEVPKCDNKAHNETTTN